MESNQLIILSKAFAVDIISLCENLRQRKKATAILNQLLRSGTSIGANIHEANYASSKADFINKFQIALKECYETDYWLDIFHDAGIITDEEFSDIMYNAVRLENCSLPQPQRRRKTAKELTDRVFQLKQEGV